MPINTDEILDNYDDFGKPTEVESNLRILIGDQHSYYYSQWAKHEEGHFLSFNYYTLLFGISWLCYRKMYLESVTLALFLGVLSVISTYDGFTKIGNQIDSFLVIWLISRIGLALYANKLYKHSLERRLARLHEKNYSEIEFKRELFEKGGISWPAVVIGLISFYTFIIWLSNFYKT